MRFDELVGRDVVIWGAGREGRAAHAELARRGIAATFAVTGASDVPTDLAASAVAGAAAQERLESAEVIIKSPGVPKSSAEFLRIEQRGIAVTSLTDLWLSANASRVLAVTGTKGKSTTSSLAQHLLNSVGITATLVGNGGTPVTAGDSPDALVAVTEVSSYQAADLSTSPRVAVVTSLFPEHLPWHGGFERYVDDKLNLVAHGCEVVVVPDLAGELADWVRARTGTLARLVAPASLGLSSSDAGIAWDGVGALPSAGLPLRGRHNLANAAMALTAVAAGYDLDVDRRVALLEAVRSYVPLRHRLETVPSDDGRTWVDDSLATAPEAVVAALETFPDARVALVLGGADRGLSFEPLRRYLAARSAEALVTVSAVGPAGARWLAETPDGATDPGGAGTFADALRRLRAEPGRADVVLLSPGAPSFDEFVSFEERSAVFRAAARGELPVDDPR